MSVYDKVYLTEKDSQVEALAPVLGCEYKKKWHPAYSKDKKIAIVPLQGHLIELLKYPHDYDEAFKDWNDKTVYCFPKKFKTKPKKRTIDLLNRAVDHLKKAKEIIIATDFDNEGAALAMRVIEYAGVEDKVSHMLEMGSMDENALKNAIKNPINIPYRSMADTGYARAYIDWAEGMTLSRALTLYLAKKKSVVIFGGVKSPLINMVVERDLQFENHKSLKYFYITGTVSSNGKSFEVNVIRKEKVTTKDKKGKTKEEIKNFKEIEKKEVAEQLMEKIKNIGNFNVEQISRKNKTENAPQLYDLTSLQAELASKYNLNPDQSLEIAQKLYDQFKIQTYPRTAIKYLKEEEYDAVPNILKNLAKKLHKEEIAEILKNPIPKRKSVFNSAKVTSHGALAPTEKDLNSVYDSLNNLQRNTFELVAKRYIANFMPPYEYKETSGEIHLFDNYYMTFKENKPEKPGYKKIYDSNIEKKIAEFESTIPENLSKGDSVSVESLNLNEGESKPKPRFTMETLLRAMENISNLYPEDPLVKEYLGENGIGTPATRSSIIKELMTPEKEGQEPWLVQKGKQIISTERARRMIKAVPKEIVSPIKRAKLNQHLEKIEKGEIDIEKFLEYYRNELKKTVELIKKHGEDPNNVIQGIGGKKVVSLGKCPLCGGDIYEKPKAYICSNASWSKDEKGKWTNSGCNFTIWKNALEKFGGKKLSPLDIKALLKKGRLKVKLKSQRTKKSYEKEIVIDEKWGVKVDF